ncbi:ankyrin [Mytilinidion resinicola]|uniref:Ankyrin n=1 Tax=Mytilinidion resinicola TaxID=574789 RepID=A0A6A6YCZ2_9PEZI|nr:ankyrin [Mytilinidion resinicola]KAF2806383.1 ankyrin [Mytilinidion resinicola]
MPCDGKSKVEMNLNGETVQRITILSYCLHADKLRMDAVSAGASVLAIVGFALQGTKILYESISGVKDAPPRVKSLASAVADLKSILTQLQSCRALTDPDADLQNIISLIQACSRDVQRYQKNINKLQIIPADAKVKQGWKRLKTVLKKDDIKQAVHDQQQNTLLLQRTEDVSIINSNLQGFKASTVDQIRDTVTSIAEKLENAPTGLETRSEDIFTLLKAIQAQISGSSTQSNVAQGPSSPRRQTPRDIDDERFTDEDSRLQESLRRLCQLDFEEGRTWRDEEADGIIDDLHLLLQSISSSHQLSKRSDLGKRKIDTTDPDEFNNRVMKRLCGIITASQSVDVNKACMSFHYATIHMRPRNNIQEVPRSSLIKAKKVIQKRKNMDVSTTLYKANISITERRITSEHDSNTNNDEKLDTIETITRIKAFVRHGDLNNVLVAQIRQFRLSTGFSCRNPFVSIGKTLPDDSPIFSVVRKGDVEELQQLLSRGEATLRDRDSWGTPLLHYAMEQPSMCKFLLENGADVDEVAFAPDDRKNAGLALFLPWTYMGSDTELKESLLECKRLLLYAGADPSIPKVWHGIDGVTTEESSSWIEVVDTGSLEYVKAIVHLARPFIDLNPTSYEDTNPLFRLAENCSAGFDATRFKFLLDAGSNIHARDVGGRTCLHIAIRHVKASRTEREYAALILLIQSGADVFSTDYLGNSISHSAYTCTSDSRRKGYRGDLWDAVLSYCGYDISAIRKGYPRKTPQYGRATFIGQAWTRERFERLWKGREGQCPYYHDPPIWRSPLSPNPEDDAKKSAQEEDIASEELRKELWDWGDMDWGDMDWGDMDWDDMDWDKMEAFRGPD